MSNSTILPSTLMALFVLLNGINSAFAENFIYIQVHNGTPGLITEVHIRVSGSGEDWSPSLLNADAIRPGQLYTLNNIANAPPCVYDIAYVIQLGPGLNDQEYATWNRVNLCSLNGMSVRRMGPNSYNARWRNER